MRSKMSAALLLVLLVAGTVWTSTPAAAQKVARDLGCCVTGDCCCPGQGSCCGPNAKAGKKSCCK